LDKWLGGPQSRSGHGEERSVAPARKMKRAYKILVGKRLFETTIKRVIIQAEI
jgi:hypothetical protein